MELFVKRDGMRIAKSGIVMINRTENISKGDFPMLTRELWEDLEESSNIKRVDKIDIQTGKTWCILKNKSIFYFIYM